METNKFIALLLKTRHELVSSNTLQSLNSTNNNLTDGDILVGGDTIIPAVSKFFTFPCDFDSEGSCVRYRGANHQKYHKDGWIPIKCCCSSCARYIGYLGKYWPTDLSIIQKYARRFQEDVGFYREGRGCILPRHMRSLICTYHVCGEIKQEFEKINRDKLDLFYLIRDYKYSTNISKELLHDEILIFLLKKNLYYDPDSHKFLKITKIKLDTLAGRDGKENYWLTLRGLEFECTIAMHNTRTKARIRKMLKEQKP